MNNKKPERCLGCNLLKQRHYKQTFFIIDEWNEEYNEWEQTYKDWTGKPREIKFTCNNEKCPVYQKENN